MYSLTDFSLKELRIIDKLVDDKIKKINSFTRHIMEIMPEDSDSKNEIMKRNSSNLPDLREIQVRLLTAIDIVKSKETTNAN